jgi:hypothetical protein
LPSALLGLAERFTEEGLPTQTVLSIGGIAQEKVARMVAGPLEVPTRVATPDELMVRILVFSEDQVTEALPKLWPENEAELQTNSTLLLIVGGVYGGI